MLKKKSHRHNKRQHTKSKRISQEQNMNCKRTFSSGENVDSGGVLKKVKKQSLAQTRNSKRENVKKTMDSWKKSNQLTSNACYEGQKYHCSLENIDKMLDKYGVAILPGILNEEEIQAMNLGMWDTVEAMTRDFDLPVDRNNPQSFKSMKHLFPLHSFLFQHWEIGHAKYVWDVRASPSVRTVFQHLYATDKLVSSFDGVSIFLPPENSTKKTMSRAEKLWMHTDQRFCYDTVPEQLSIQSWVTGYDVDPGSATLAFFESSHKFHSVFGKHFELEDCWVDDWYKLETEAEYEFLQNQCNCPLKAITCRAGDMVLWNSKTFHCGMRPLAGTQAVPRNVVYVSMTPQNWCTLNVLRKRQEFFLQKRMTTHTPHRPKLFAKIPRTYGADVSKIQKPPQYNYLQDFPSHACALIPI